MRLQPPPTPQGPCKIVSQSDTLAPLRQNLPLQRKIEYLHGVINLRYDCIHRMAVAVYDAKTDLLKTFVHSSESENPLNKYESRLAGSATLSEIRNSGRARIVNDLSVFDEVDRPHARKLRESGFGSSYTLPIFEGESFFGFLFFNSQNKGIFVPDLLHYLDLCGHLLALAVIQEVCKLQTLTGAVHTARNMTHHRDNETGGHLDRMSRYARMIAQVMAAKRGLDDEYVEHIFLFSPLHDIGKIAIPDDILLKPGRLERQEFEVMKTHTQRGGDIITSMLANLGLADYHHIDILYNIAMYHHETLDGLGYPHGLLGGEIPLEARIVAVADIFDALTSQRPYKEAWSVEDAFAFLQQQAGTKLDAECVEALISNRERIEEIRLQFYDEQVQENPFPAFDAD